MEIEWSSDWPVTHQQLDNKHPTRAFLPRQNLLPSSYKHDWDLYNDVYTDSNIFELQRDTILEQSQ